MPTRRGAWLPSPLLQEQELGERARLGMVDESKYQVPGMFSPAAATDEDGPGTGTGMGTGKGSKGKKTRRKNSRRAAMTPEVVYPPLTPSYIYTSVSAFVIPHICPPTPCSSRGRIMGA